MAAPIGAGGGVHHYMSVVTVRVDYTTDAMKLADADGNTFLHNACKTGDVNTVEGFLRYGGRSLDLEARNGKKETMLELALKGGHQLVVEKLLAAHVRLDTLTSEDLPPVHFAAKCGHLALVMLLHRNRASLDANRGTQGYREMINLVTRYNGDPQIVEYIIGYAPADLINEPATPIVGTSVSMLTHAACYRRIEIAQILFRIRCNPNLPTFPPLSRPSVFWTIFSAGTAPDGTSCTLPPDIPLLQLFINNGAFVLVTDQAGDSPLHVACEHLSSQAIVLLLQYSARQEANIKGETPLELYVKNLCLKYGSSDADASHVDALRHLLNAGGVVTNRVTEAFERYGYSFTQNGRLNNKEINKILRHHSSGCGCVLL